MIEVNNITKAWGRRRVLHDVTLSVDSGEVVGFVGPNGAGKTTTLRIITGYLDADSGRVLVDGFDVAAQRAQAVERIGYLPESTPLYGDMRVREFLRFRAVLKGMQRRVISARIAEVVEITGLGDVKHRLIGELSKGFRQRVGLADALLARPPVLILDEPTAGLDPVQVRELRGLLGELARDRTVLLSSHILPEVERVASRIVVLVAGRVVANGTPDELRAELGLARDADIEDVFVAFTRAAESSNSSDTVEQGSE